MNLLINLPFNTCPSKTERFMSKVSYATLQCYTKCFIDLKDGAFCNISQRVKDINYFQKSSILEALKTFF